MSFIQSQVNATQRRILFRLVGVTNLPIAGFVPTAVIVIKNGAYAAGSAVRWHEIDAVHAPGWYYYEFAQAELDTLGQIGIEVTGAALLNGFAINGDSVGV